MFTKTGTNRRKVMAYFWLLFVLSIIVDVHNQIGIAKASLDIGVCYGMIGNNLPLPTHVINLYKRYGIGKMRLFDPNPDALNALRGSNIQVTIGVRNEDVANLASSPDAANSWFAANMQPFLNDVQFSYIAVGNEIIPGKYATHILPAMQNLQSILKSKNLAGIKVTTVISTATLGTSYPPSNGAFTPEASSILGDILRFMSTQGSPLMVNVYPYFAYAADPGNVPLSYAQFTATSPVVQDCGLSYYNLFDAMVDAFHSAMEKLGVPDVRVVVSESGWPSAGNGEFTTPELAAKYNHNFVKHILRNTGTPKRPGTHIEGFVFAMFNENLKPAGVEQNFGLFFPSMKPVCHVFNSYNKIKNRKVITGHSKNIVG